MAGTRRVKIQHLAAPLSRLVGAVLAFPAAAAAWIVSASHGVSLATGVTRAVGGAAFVYFAASIASRFLFLSVLETWDEERRKKAEGGIR